MIYYGEQQVFAYDGASIQQLTNHVEYPYINELDVISRDRLFLTSYDVNGYELFVYEYDPATYGDTFTHRLVRNPGTGPGEPDNRMHINNLTSADSGLYFEVDDGFGGLRTMFASGLFGYGPVDGFNLGTNGDRGFEGRMPLSSFAFPEGAEPTFFSGTTPELFTDIAPGLDPEFGTFPASSYPGLFVQLDDGSSLTVDPIYTVATIPSVGPDKASVFRLTYNGIDYDVDPVSGLTAIGNPPLPTDIREYLFPQYAFGDVTLVSRGIFDPVLDQYIDFELWLVEGLTASKIDDDAGFITRTEAVRAGNVLFYEDEVNPTLGREVGLWNLDTDTGMTVDIVPGSFRSDPREFTSAGGGAYVRAITEVSDRNGDLDLDDWEDWDLELVRIETTGTFTVIDLRSDVDFIRSSAPRQITAIDSDTVVVFGDTATGPKLWAVTGTAIDYTIDLPTAAGIVGVPFLEGGTEMFEGDLFFFADDFDGVQSVTQLFRFDPDTLTLENITLGVAPENRGAFDYSMEVADGLLWFVFDFGYGDGLELSYYGNPFGGSNFISSVTDFDGYEPIQLVGLELSGP
jgi:hypothetical protein